MNASVVSGVLVLLFVVIVGASLSVTAPAWTGPRRLARARFRAGTAADGLVSGFGRLGAAVVVVLTGGGFMMLSLWLLGEFAQRIESSVDHPLFHWFAARQTEPWSSWWWFLTDIGKVSLTQRICALAAVVFTVLYARRRWWAPPFLLIVGFLSEKLIQEALKVLVDRGHPPTTLGTWPSGGCGRVAVVYGLIMWLTLRWFEVRSLSVWVAGWTVVALAETVQAYARTVNLEHWFTDVVGGVLFGIMLLLTMTAAGKILLPAPPEIRATPDVDATPERATA
jgi:hypothetical protein